MKKQYLAKIVVVQFFLLTISSCAIKDYDYLYAIHENIIERSQTVNSASSQFLISQVSDYHLLSTALENFFSPILLIWDVVDWVFNSEWALGIRDIGKVLIFPIFPILLYIVLDKFDKLKYTPHIILLLTGLFFIAGIVCWQLRINLRYTRNELEIIHSTINSPRIIQKEYRKDSSVAAIINILGNV